MEKIRFFDSLRELLESGVELNQALELAGKKTSIDTGEMIRFLDSGATLSSALQKFPEIFETRDRRFVELGEKSGEMARFLGALVKELEQEAFLQRELKTKLFGTVIVLHIGFALAALWTLLPTEWLGEFTPFFGYLTAFLVCSLMITIFRKRVCALVARSLSGSAFRSWEIAGFLSRYDVLLESGLGSTQAWDLALETVRGKHLVQKLTLQTPKIVKGVPIEDTLYDILAEDNVQQLRRGREHGHFPKALKNVATAIEREAKSRLRKNANRTIAVVVASFGLVLVGLFPFTSKQSEPRPLSTKRGRLFRTENVDQSRTLVKLGEDLVLFPLVSTMDFEAAERAEVVAKRLEDLYGKPCSLCKEFKVMPRDIRVAKYTVPESMIEETVVFYSHVDNGVVVTKPLLLVTITEEEAQLKEATKSTVACFWRDLTRDVLAISQGTEVSRTVLGLELSSKLADLRVRLGNDAGVIELDEMLRNLNSKERFVLRNAHRDVPDSFMNEADEFTTLKDNHGSYQPLGL